MEAKEVNNRMKCLCFLLLLAISQTSMLFLMNDSQIKTLQLNDPLSFLDQDFSDKIKLSSNGNQNVIVSFNSPSFDGNIKKNFTDYGGNVKKEWNNTFSSMSGFSGIISAENLTIFQANWPQAIVEADEVIEVQMNYASLQSGAVNSTWDNLGYKGNTNSSVAVLDTGINANHEFFPNGFQSINLSGVAVGWKNFVNSNPISDDNGHGTFISSIISGTGNEPFNNSNPTKLSLYGNYSHTDLFGNDYNANKNYTSKIFTFNQSKPNSCIILNATWYENGTSINKFWFEM